MFYCPWHVCMYVVRKKGMHICIYAYALNLFNFNYFYYIFEKILILIIFLTFLKYLWFNFLIYAAVNDDDYHSDGHLTSDISVS